MVQLDLFLFVQIEILGQKLKGKSSSYMNIYLYLLPEL